jgi:hypothetical protein
MKPETTKNKGAFRAAAAPFLMQKVGKTHTMECGEKYIETPL